MDLKTNEILFLNYLSKIKRKNKISEYWKYDYGINIDYEINKLFLNGYLEEIIDVQSNLSRLTVPQLKEFLKNHDIDIRRQETRLN